MKKLFLILIAGLLISNSALANKCVVPRQATTSKGETYISFTIDMKKVTHLRIYSNKLVFETIGKSFSVSYQNWQELKNAMNFFSKLLSECN